MKLSRELESSLGEPAEFQSKLDSLTFSMIYEIGSDDNGLVCLMMAGSRRQLKKSGCIQGK